ncbi:MAG TPA: AAA family ATPase, partial [Nitrososphaerales archaeon]|nr:AAA family ATPase [Nitrososphaerales archaeon]
EKHRPKSLEEMVGNEEARAKFQLWLRKWKPGAKAALLVGPPGTGKTTTVHLVAAKTNHQLVELNASDSRTKDKLSKKMGEAIGSSNLFGTGTLIFLDEVDGLAGRSDYGALDFIKDAVRSSENPVVMAANDPDADEVRKLASVTTKIEFRKPDDGEVEARLDYVSKAEGMAPGPEELHAIVRAANGDFRSAINFLQSGIPAAKDEELTAAAAINGFFGATDSKEALKALRSYPGQPRDKLRDLFNGVVRSKVHEERRAGALEVLSRADMLMGRIFRGRDWRLLRYLDLMLSEELWRALGDGGPRYTLDALPWPLQIRIWNDSKKLKEIASRSGRRLGISARGFLVEDAPYVLVMCSDRSFRQSLVRSLDLEENFEEFIAKEALRSTKRQL